MQFLKRKIAMHLMVPCISVDNVVTLCMRLRFCSFFSFYRELIVWRFMGWDWYGYDMLNGTRKNDVCPRFYYLYTLVPRNTLYERLRSSYLCIGHWALVGGGKMKKMKCFHARPAHKFTLPSVCASCQHHASRSGLFLVKRRPREYTTQNISNTCYCSSWY